MKLKKIASLALAGLMAVSMLAGCGNNANSGNNNNNGAVSTSIVDAVNNGQASYNDVKVAFTADAKLQDAVDKVVAAHGNYIITNSTQALSEIKQYAGLVDTIDDVDNFKSDTKAPTKDGEKVTYFNYILLGMVDASEAYLNNQAVAEINELVAKLDDTTLVTADDYKNDPSLTITKDGATYYDFSYTGKICMSEVNVGGMITGYVAVVVIEQTAAEKTL